MKNNADDNAKLRAELAQLQARVVTLEAENAAWADQLNQARAAFTKTQTLFQATRSITALEPLPDLLQLIVDNLALTLPAAMVSLATVDMNSRRVTLLVEGGSDLDQFPTRDGTALFDELSEGLVGWVLRELKPVHSPKGTLDPRESNRARQDRLTQGAGSIIVAPIHYRRKIWGALTAINLISSPDFDDADLGLLVTMANQAAFAIENAHLFEALRESEARYRSLFEDSPISLWEQDFSKVKKTIDALKLAGITDFETYFEDHPDQVGDCAAAVRVVDVNQATLGLFQARSKRQFFQGIDQVFTSEAIDTFKEVLIAISQDILSIELETVNNTLAGNRRNIVLTWSVAPGYEATLSKVLVSIIDVTERKQAEEALASRANELEEARNFLDSIIENIPLMVFVKDSKNLRFVRFNKAGEDLIGVKRQELIGKNVYDCFSEEEATRFSSKDRETLVTRSLLDIPEQPIETATKGTRLLHTTKVPVFDKNGNPKYLLGISEDITERKRAEAALIESEERYRNLVELSPDGVLVSIAEKIAFINRSGAKILGANSPDELINKCIYDFTHPDSLDDVKLRLKKVATQGWHAPLSEQKIFNLGGTLTYLEVASIPAIYQGRAAVQTVFRDITQRKQAELELARFRAIMDQSDETILVVDPETARFIDVNKTACRELGYSREELLRLGPAQIVVNFPFEDHARWKAHVENVKETSSFLVRYTEHRRKDGSSFPVQTMLSYHSFEGRNYLLAISRDMTEIKHLEDQLHQAQKLEAVGQLAGGVAHNFNNMLTAIMGYVGLSMESLPPDHPVKQDLLGIEKTTQRAAGLTQQLLAFTRNQIIQPTIIDLNNLVLNMRGMLRQLVNESIELIIISNPNLDPVRVDPGQFEQVLVNLVLNARDAMPDGGQLIIETTNITIDQSIASRHEEVRRTGNYVMLSVSDTGSGMTEEVKTHIFEPFFTTKEVGQGTGLGLATCFGIVKQNNGYISVYSEPGQGTSFKIYLSRIRGVADEPDPSGHIDPLPAGTETILLVEDEATVRKTTARILHEQGYAILEARNGDDALRLVKQMAPKTIQLLITDVVMPGLGGMPLAREIERIDPDIKILFISGYTENTIIQRGIAEPGINFLPKPFAPSDIAIKVRQLLDNAE